MSRVDAARHRHKLRHRLRRHPLPHRRLHFQCNAGTLVLSSELDAPPKERSRALAIGIRSLEATAVPRATVRAQATSRCLPHIHRRRLQFRHHPFRHLCQHLLLRRLHQYAEWMNATTTASVASASRRSRRQRTARCVRTTSSRTQALPITLPIATLRCSRQSISPAAFARATGNAGRTISSTTA